MEEIQDILLELMNNKLGSNERIPTNIELDAVGFTTNFSNWSFYKCF